MLHFISIVAGLLLAVQAFAPSEDAVWSPVSVKLTSGFVELPLPGKIPTEAAETVHFRRPLPDFDAEKMLDHAGALAKLLSTSGGDISNAAHSWKQSIRGLVSVMRTVRAQVRDQLRSRRGLAFMGSALNWCCDVATDAQLVPLVANEKRLRNTMAQLVNAHATLEGDLVHTVGELRNFSSAVDAGILAAQDQRLTQFSARYLSAVDVQVHMQEMLALLTESLAHEMVLSTAVTACAGNHLSPQLVSADVLRAAIGKMLSRLDRQRLRLAVPDVAQLFTAEIAHWSMTETDLHICVKVPLVSITSDWTVVQYAPLPSVWGNSTCRLFPEPVVAVRSGRTIIPLQG